MFDSVGEAQQSHPDGLFDGLSIEAKGDVSTLIDSAVLSAERDVRMGEPAETRVRPLSRDLRNASMFKRKLCGSGKAEELLSADYPTSDVARRS